MRRPRPRLQKIPPPELIRPRNNRRSHGTVFVRALRPSQIGIGVNPQCEAHWEYNASRTQRRHFITAIAAAGLLHAQKSAPRKGRLKQGVTAGVFDPKMSFEDQCRLAADLGCVGFDLVPPQDWHMLKKYGLTPTMDPQNGGVTIPDGMNKKENHDKFEKAMRPAIDQCAAGGCPNLITFSGNRRGMPDQEGADNCVAFLNRVKAQAEDKGITICMELLNSKVNHKDYMCDHAAWGVEVVKRVNSPRVKLLYDIYHMQTMEGDVCRTITDNFQWIAHFHTGGVPGRHEIDDTQELNYRFVAKTIADLGYTGYISHEYRPAPGRDAKESLKQAIEIMTV
jgi:hydroxypyruvate isomerase